MQVRLVKSEVIVGQQTFQSRIDFYIVVVVNSVNVARTVVDGAFQLSRTIINTRLRQEIDKTCN